MFPLKGNCFFHPVSVVFSLQVRLRNVFQLIQYLENKDFHKFVVPLVPNLTPRVFPAELLNTGNDFEIANYRPCI